MRGTDCDGYAERDHHDVEPWTERLYQMLLERCNAIERGLIVSGSGSERAWVIASPVHAASIYQVLQERCAQVEVIDTDSPCMVYLVTSGDNND